MFRTVGLFALGLILFGSSSAHAQVYRPGYVYPGTTVYNPYGGAGGYLAGSADVMNAYGNVINQQEQARILREQANQAKLDTRKKSFDQMMYEKNNTPSYTEELSKEKAMLLTRLMNHPIKSEIVNGTTLNAMLPLIQDLSNRGTQGPPVPISQSMVNQLNIAGSTGGSVGMLRASSIVEWPIGLRGPEQKKLDKLIPQACDGVINGTLEPKTMKSIYTEMSTMRERIKVEYQKDVMDVTTYSRAVEFYNSLDKSIRALERPDAKKQLTGAYSPRARNVQELVDFMTDNGVQFAASTPGNENAYQVTHDAFVRYSRTAQGSSGLQALNTPVKAPAPKRK